MAGTALQIIAGLGNPGPEHRLSRHNAGFWFVDALARAEGAQFRAHSRYHGEICRVTLEGQVLVLLKPQTYMNRSGIAVRACTTNSTCRPESRGSSLAVAPADTTGCAT